MGRTAKYDETELLDRAMARAWEHGWQQTSIRDLEQVLDLKAPSIYRRYGSRDGLGAAIVDHYVDRVVRRRVDKFLHGDGDPIENLRTFLDRSVTEPDDGGRLWGCLLTSMSDDTASGSPEFDERLARGRAIIADGIDREVRRADSLGSLAPGAHADDVTRLLTLAMQGLMASARAGVPSDELRRQVASTIAVVAA